MSRRRRPARPTTAPTPYWLTAPCPPWCNGKHGASDHPEDRNHWRYLEPLTLRQHQAVATNLTNTEWRPSRLDVTLTQHVDSTVGTVLMVRDEHGPTTLELNAGEARELARRLVIAADHLDSGAAPGRPDGNRPDPQVCQPARRRRGPGRGEKMPHA